MFYNYLRYRDYMPDAQARRRAASNLIKLRAQLDATVPPKDSEDNLILATWNVRDFDKRNRRGWGKRLPESLFYIAEVISRFDFVAVQEVNRLDEWRKVMRILGRSWGYIATDETDPKIGGNGERMVFVYDRRKVSFQSIASEIVLPPQLLISKAEVEFEGKRVVAGNQFKRTPFFASFQSGWLKFDICTVHLYYGSSSGEKLKQRIEEIETIARYLGERADRALGKDRALILLGDFNIVSPEHETMKALLDQGFTVPAVLKSSPTTGTEKHYDQIAFKTEPHVVEYVDRRSQDPMKKNAGVIPLFDRVFSNRQFDTYRDIVATKTTAGRSADSDAKLRKAYKQWRTYQFSDHYPMWVRLETDGSDGYLRRMAAQDTQ